MSTNNKHVAIVGVGPRGISVLERIAAALNHAPQPDSELTIHLIEKSQMGAGSIWRTDQTRTLCMNTLAGAVTLFTEPGSTVISPVVEGPLQFDWIRLLRGDADLSGIPEKAIELFRTYPPEISVAEDFREELSNTVIQSNPSRALYGAYLRWAFDVALHLLPEWVKVEQHHARAIGLREDGEHDVITLDNAEMISVDSTVLSIGWQTPAPNAEEQSIMAALEEHSNLAWVKPGNPVVQNASIIPAGEEVLVRGLGMGFFDIMALTTIDRGGVFHEDPSTRSGLRYEASGQEPHFVISSGRGYPYLPKSDYKSLPPGAKLARLKAVIAAINAQNRGVASINYDMEVWPAVARDSYEAFYETLNRVNPEAIHTSLDKIVEIIDEVDVDKLPKALAAHAAEGFDLQDWEFPLAGINESAEALTTRIADGLARDIRHAVLAWDSPLKSALWSISAARKPSSILGAEGRFTFESRRNRFAAVMAIGQMVGSGPPLFRTRELLALIDAGLAHFIGARPRLSVHNGQWQLASTTTGDAPVRADVLVDAWMHNPDVRRSADPLALSLEEAGRVRAFNDYSTDGTAAPTGSPEVDPATRLLVHPNGNLDPRVHLIGIPTYGQLPDTTISPMPGTNPLMLQETDKTAVHVLRHLGLI
ncbi:FAD/NAD(P)-binding protein [Corynebacterium crudilactis]|uniref:Exopolyphosphatase n=1 Tax=Corynebacterium crudilactis TaxID=1652495 RepID=A0A172QVD5_9CORY|nr:FAD/NAD(P)-binding protein [Corynebacterium crudilactis]ANE04667.1 exopolyphosphatase [Corynebacterium crudilactis]